MVYDPRMIARVHDKIREILESKPGLTQKGLALRMGLNPAAVNRMLYGRRNILVEEIPIIESYLGEKLSISRQMPRGFEDGARQEPFSPNTASQPMVPVYSIEKPLDLDAAPVDWTPRHPTQNGISAAFAVYVFSNDMEPRYFKGELVYLHPGRPPEPGRDCLVRLKDGPTLLRRMTRQDDDKIRVAQYRPVLEKDLPRGEIEAIYAVIGRG